MKINKCISMEKELYEWLLTFPNSSQIISELLQEKYENDKNPNAKYKRLLREKEKVEEDIERVVIRLGKLREEGNKIERETAEALLKEEQERIVRAREELSPMLKELQKHPRWEDFVNSFKDLEATDLITWNDMFIQSGIDTKGWSNLRKIMGRFSIEELKLKKVKDEIQR